jgi:hypothetical protein
MATARQTEAEVREALKLAASLKKQAAAISARLDKLERRTIESKRLEPLVERLEKIVAEMAKGERKNA